jgi:cytochrome c-type biogenesis protein CcmE
MKKSHIVLICLVAVVSAILVSTYTASVDSSTFAQAKAEPNKSFKITGTFDKTRAVEYDALRDANLTIFHVVDATGKSHEVHLHDDQGKPMGLEQSESVTIEGKFDAATGEFHAHHLLMKCPSKYNDQKHSLSAENN